MQIGALRHALEEYVKRQRIVADGVERLRRADLAVLYLLLGRSWIRRRRQDCEQRGDGESWHAHDVVPYSAASTL
jgi:hypothetical protein